MGMPYAIRAISRRGALVLIAIVCAIGATFASERDQSTVGLHIVRQSEVTVLMTLHYGDWSLHFNDDLHVSQATDVCYPDPHLLRHRGGLAAGIQVAWVTIVRLAVTWIAAPVAAMLLGWLGTKLLQRRSIPRRGRMGYGARGLSHAGGLRRRNGDGDRSADMGTAHFAACGV
jgi:PiT family inorganic phosphate transporter